MTTDIKPDLTTDAISRYVRSHQLPGRTFSGRRLRRLASAVLCGTEITNTALALRGLSFYMPAADKADIGESDTVRCVVAGEGAVEHE